MEIEMIAGMLFLWTLLMGLAVFLYRGLSQTKKHKERFVRVEIDPEEDLFRLRNKQ